MTGCQPVGAYFLELGISGMTIAHEAAPCAVDRADEEVIGERYFTSLTIDAHLPDSYYSLLFALVYLSKGGRPIARGITELSARTGLARSTVSLAYRGLTEKGFARPALRKVGGRPLRGARCPRGGTNVRLSSHQMTVLAHALADGRATGFEVRLLLWLVHNRAEDGRNAIVGYRRNDIATRLGVARRRITQSVRTLERLDLLAVHRGRRQRWTLTPIAAIPSQHPKPAAVLKAARVARELSGHDRDPAEAIDAAAWATSHRAQRAAKRGTRSNTQRGTESNTSPSTDRTFSQVKPAESARYDASPSRGSCFGTALSSVERRRSWEDRVREFRPDVADRFASRRKRE
jgi:hypothetical protein